MVGVLAVYIGGVLNKQLLRWHPYDVELKKKKTFRGKIQKSHSVFVLSFLQ